MSEPTPAKPKKKYEGIPVGRLLIVLTALSAIGLAAYGAMGLYSMMQGADYPIVGEWQAKGKPWRINFRPDKTIVSTTGPSQAGASQAWASEPGTYKVNFFGNLWVTLKSGKTYSALLVSPAENLPAVPRDRFDLIESGTESVTVFERAQPTKPAPSGPPKESQTPQP